MKKTIAVCMLVLAVGFLLTACGSAGSRVPDPEKIVPARESLIENLEDSGYSITTLTAVEGSDIRVDRILAQKGKKYMDIVYGLSAADAEEIFERYCELYPDDYYILAQNGNYVYCVSDKKTFSKAGFTSTANVGVQYIQ